jgi:hypothetical protein
MNNIDIDGINFNLKGLPDSYQLEDLLTTQPPTMDQLPDGTFAWSVPALGYFDALFHRFGLMLSTSDPRFADDEYRNHMWYRCVGHLGAYIEAEALWPKIVARQREAWPAGFAEYVQSVVDADYDAARRWAVKLNIEKLDAPMPRELMG